MPAQQEVATIEIKWATAVRKVLHQEMKNKAGAIFNSSDKINVLISNYILSLGDFSNVGKLFASCFCSKETFP